MRRVHLILAGLALLTPVVRGEEAVRTLRAELPAGAARFSIENLVGTMRIHEGPVSAVTAVATVHGESAALAEAVRLERVPGTDGSAALRVRYPYDKVGTFRYREPGSHDDEFWLGFSSSSSYHYDGHSVRVNRGQGTRLWADVEVEIPRGESNARFQQLAGLVEAEGLRGRLRFEVASADLRLRGLEGALELEGSSGDVRARDIKGTWKSDFSSGDCRLDGFEGESLELHASSGDLDLRSIKAKRVVTETNSGDVRLLDADLEELHAEATSGDVELEAAGARLKTVDVSTSSGNVALRLPADAQFEASARQSSGDMSVEFRDGTSTQKGSSLVGYRRGDHGARIRVRTSSGDLSISPI